MKRRFFITSLGIATVAATVVPKSQVIAQSKYLSIPEMKQYAQDVLSGKISPESFLHDVANRDDIEVLLLIKYMVVKHENASPILCSIDKDNTLFYRLRKLKQEESAVAAAIFSSQLNFV